MEGLCLLRGFWSRHELHEQLLEAGQVQVKLGMNEVNGDVRLELRGPGEGIAIGGAVIDVDIHVELLFTGDEGGVDPGAGGELVPHVIAVLAPGGNIARCGGVGAGDLVEHLLGEGRLDGDVDGGDVDARPVGLKDDVGSLGVEPEVELVARGGGEFGIVGLWVEAATHEDNSIGESGESGVDGDGQGNVGEGASGEDGDLMGMGVDLTDEEVGSVFADGLEIGPAFRHGRNDVGAVGMGA
jgi:hypothetical protein